MNRIAEHRRKRGLSQGALAALVGTTQPTIQRIESGAQNLTEEWMMRIAEALEVSPIDLLGIAVVAELRDEVEPIVFAVDGNIAAALAMKGLAAYRVTASSVSNLGIGVGSTIPVDTSSGARTNVATGALVVARVSRRHSGEHLGLVLRQFIAPGLLTTNKPGRNASFGLDDDELSVEIIGVALPVTETTLIKVPP
jgi:transcriptional regulator with XRE-family HTH domain